MPPQVNKQEILAAKNKLQAVHYFTPCNDAEYKNVGKSAAHTTFDSQRVVGVVHHHKGAPPAKPILVLLADFDGGACAFRKVLYVSMS